MSKFRQLIALAAMSLLSLGAQAQAPANFVLTVDGFESGGDIPVRFTQAAEGAAPGGGTSPELSWVNAPQGTQSFVVNMVDLDNALNNGPQTQVHWLVWNIPGDATGLAEDQPAGDQLPNGASQISATGRVYRGPGAPATRPKHHYLFEVYALDTTINVTATDDPVQTREAVMAAIDGHILTKSVYVGRFHRPQ